MKNICFFDMSNGGHHWFYNFSLMKGLNKASSAVYYFTGSLDEDQKFKLTQENINYYQIIKTPNMINNLFFDIYILISLAFYCKKNRINRLFILYFDRFMVPFLIIYPLFKINRISVNLTLHWYPNRKIKQLILKIIINLYDVILIVHTKDILTKINGITKKINKVKIIPYPVSETEIILKEKAKEKLGMQDIDLNIITLLYFGGTRFDKGIDILFNSLKHLTNKLNLIIAGKEEYFTRQYIQDQCNELKHVNCLVNLKFIPDEEVKYYFSICDIVILPYRKIFNGESGILTEALNYGKPLIVPNIIHFPDVINEYNNGLVYECEDYMDLAKKIETSIYKINELQRNAEKCMNKYRDLHSQAKFINGYLELV